MPLKPQSPFPDPPPRRAAPERAPQPQPLGVRRARTRPDRAQGRAGGCPPIASAGCCPAPPRPPWPHYLVPPDAVVGLELLAVLQPAQRGVGRPAGRTLEFHRFGGGDGVELLLHLLGIGPVGSNGLWGAERGGSAWPVRAPTQTHPNPLGLQAQGAPAFCSWFNPEDAQGKAEPGSRRGGGSSAWPWQGGELPDTGCYPLGARALGGEGSACLAAAAVTPAQPCRHDPELGAGCFARLPPDLLPPPSPRHRRVPRAGAGAPAHPRLPFPIPGRCLPACPASPRHPKS